MGGSVLPASGDPVNIPPLSEPVPNDWVTEEGPFLNVYAINQSWLDYSALFCPPSRLDDGVLWLVMIRPGPNWRDKLWSFLKLETAGYLDIVKYVKMVPIRCFRFSPHLCGDEGDCFMTIDAEKM